MKSLKIRIKTQFLALVCVLGLGVSAFTPSAQAGLLVAAGGGGSGVLIVGITSVVLGGGLLVDQPGGCVSGYYRGPIFICTRYIPGRRANPALAPLGFSMMGVGVGLVLLDAEPEARTSAIATVLKERYRFVDSSEAIENLAIVIGNLSSQVEFSGEEMVEVKIGENSIREAFSAADLSEENLQAVIQDLN